MAGQSLDQRTNLCYIQSPAVREYFHNERSRTRPDIRLAVATLDLQ
jgi:hypothetical protein